MTIFKNRYLGKRLGKRSEPERKESSPRFAFSKKQKIIFGSSASALGLFGAVVAILTILLDIVGFFGNLFSAWCILWLSILTGSALLVSFGGFLLLSLKFRRTSFIFLISLPALTVLALAALITLRMWISLPDPIAADPIIMNSPPQTDPYNPGGVAVTPNRPGGAGQDGYALREGVYTFLLAGIHEGNTDTLMVATLDTARGTCHVLSIPRDTYISRAPRDLKKINGAYSQRRSTWDDEPGIMQLKKEIATLIGYQPQYSAVVDYRAIRRLVDAVDGVAFNVPTRMYVPEEGINLQRGPQTLNGNQAMQLLRYRGYGTTTLKNYFDTEDPVNDDYGRMKIQQAFLTAAAKKALSDWLKMSDYIKIAQENVRSDDIDWGHMLGFAEQINKIGADNIVFNTLPTVTGRRNFYEIVQTEEALALINETINPFNRLIGAELLEHNDMRE
jgi:LCP family protein required for cell wall assembly